MANSNYGGNPVGNPSNPGKNAPWITKNSAKARVPKTPKVPTSGGYHTNSNTGASTLQGGNAAVPAVPGVFKKGGTVKQTGVAKVHKGERVLTASQARKMPLDKLEARLKK